MKLRQSGRQTKQPTIHEQKEKKIDIVFYP
jgi:hypothetical protein